MVCSLFIRRGECMMCVVTGLWQSSEDLLQGGLEIPCCYTFKAIKVSEGEKTRKIIEDIATFSGNRTNSRV